MAVRNTKTKPLHGARFAAVQVITQVLHKGRSLSGALPATLPTVASGERGLCQELCYGTLRWHPRLERLLERLLDKPLKKRDRDIHILLLIGLYQLIQLNIPAHAAVSATVEVTRQLNKAWARGLVNALLRRFLREQESLSAQLDQDPVSATAHPGWLLDALRQDWPEQWGSITAANNAHPPMTLRVNRNHHGRKAYLEELAQHGIAASAASHAPDAVTLDSPLPVDALPGFAEGRVSVQDAAAQLAAGIVDPQPGERILDACAAPGGKTGHLLEYCPTIDLTALELEADRLVRIRENLERLGLHARLSCGDASDPATWWDGQPFDRILLDAPCSATGVIRRHPDIKLLRRPDDIAQLARLQQQILNALWPLLKTGGRLVYATCSVMRRENALQVANFLAEREDCVELPLDVPWGTGESVGRQILPGQDGMDGFYYACLEKK